MPHLTQFRSFRMRSWQPITRLILKKINNSGKDTTQKYSTNPDNQTH